MSHSEPRPPAGVSRRRSGGRGEAGLTTLEWLLVVAAVAGLAALAVVVVQNLVGDTAERVTTHSARQTAADLATTELTERWAAEMPRDQDEADRINRRYEAYCRQLGIIYADVGLKVESAPGLRVRMPGHVAGWGPDPKDFPACVLSLH